MPINDKLFWTQPSPQLILIAAAFGAAPARADRAFRSALR